MSIESLLKELQKLNQLEQIKFIEILMSHLIKDENCISQHQIIELQNRIKGFATKEMETIPSKIVNAKIAEKYDLRN